MQKRNPKVMRMKAQIHDSALTQYQQQFWADRNYVGEILSHMNNPVTIHKRVLSIPVDYKLGTDWGNMKEYK